MTKRLLLIGLAVFCVGCAAQRPTPIPVPPTPLRDWTITANWNYDFTNTPQCSTTITVGCINGFTWGYLKGTTQVPLSTITPPLIACTGATQPMACTVTVNSTVGIGNIVFYIVANGLDNNGVASTSPVVNSAAVPVSTGAVTNFGVKVAP